MNGIIIVGSVVVGRENRNGKGDIFVNGKEVGWVGTRDMEEDEDFVFNSNIGCTGRREKSSSGSSYVPTSSATSLPFNQLIGGDLTEGGKITFLWTSPQTLAKKSVFFLSAVKNSKNRLQNPTSSMSPKKSGDCGQCPPKSSC